MSICDFILGETVVLIIAYHSSTISYDLVPAVVSVGMFRERLREASEWVQSDVSPCEEGSCTERMFLEKNR